MPGNVWTVNDIVKGSGIQYRLRVGKRTQWKFEPLDDTEQKHLSEFFALAEKYIKPRSPLLFETFKRQEPLIQRLTSVVKALLNGPSFGGVDPDEGEFGIALAFPQLIKYDTTTPVLWGNDSWEITISDTDVGTEKYLFGNDTTYYTGNSTEDKRTELLILEDGLFTVGTKPPFTQYKMEFEGKPYNPYHTAPLVDLEWRNGVSEETAEQIYPIDFPFGVFIPHNYGFKMSFIPEKAGTFDLRILGVVWFEYKAFSDLVWI